MTRLTAQEIATQLAALPEWRIEEGVLTRTFQFKDFHVPRWPSSTRSVSELKIPATARISTFATTVCAWA